MEHFMCCTCRCGRFEKLDTYLQGTASITCPARVSVSATSTFYSVWTAQARHDKRYNLEGKYIFFFSSNASEISSDLRSVVNTLFTVSQSLIPVLRTPQTLYHSDKITVSLTILILPVLLLSYCNHHYNHQRQHHQHYYCWYRIIL